MKLGTKPQQRDDGRRDAPLRSAARFLEDLLDEMQVTDREYHHLNLSVPLTASIIERVERTAAPGDRVLLIGGTMLLADALMRLGYELEIWRLPKTLLSGSAEQCVTGEVTTDGLPEAKLPADAYAAVIVPYVIESIPERVSQFLGALRAGLTDGGRIILATRNQTRLDNRLAAISGRPIAGRRSAGALSLSWPSLPVYAEYHRDDLPRLSREAGLAVTTSEFIDGQRLFLELEPMQIESYLLKKAGQLARRAAAPMRDTIVVELAARAGDGGPLPAMPDVCVAVAAVNGGAQLRSVLQSLHEQTYPKDRYEVVVLHDGRDDVQAIVDEATRDGAAPVREIVDAAGEGPSPRNAVLHGARAPIVGHTDDSSILPGDWIEAAVMRFDDDTAAISGPIFAGPDSHPKYLEVPGTRPDPAERERWRTDLFPIANVFYRRSAATAVGGFDAQSAGHDTRPLGWDTGLAWKLHRAGWQVRFVETLSISTKFRPAEESAPAAQMAHAAQLPSLYARVPEVRPQLVAGVFASRQSMYFDMMIAGAFVAARRRKLAWLLTAVPWLGIVSKRFGVWPPRKWLPSAKVVARIGALNLLWLAGFIKGSIRAKKVVL